MAMVLILDNRSATETTTIPQLSPAQLDSLWLTGLGSIYAISLLWLRRLIETEWIAMVAQNPSPALLNLERNKTGWLGWKKTKREADWKQNRRRHHDEISWWRFKLTRRPNKQATWSTLSRHQPTYVAHNPSPSPSQCRSGSSLSRNKWLPRNKLSFKTIQRELAELCVVMSTIDWSIDGFALDSR